VAMSMDNNVVDGSRLGAAASRANDGSLPTVADPPQEQAPPAPTAKTRAPRTDEPPYRGLWYLDFPEHNGGFFGSGN
jgi:hypothetical protein